MTATPERARVEGSGAPGAGLLTADCGNSTLKVVDHATGRRLAVDARAPDVDVLCEFLRASGARRCAAASVVAGGLAALELAASRAGVRLLVAGAELPCPLPLAYDTPQTLGADRWVSALAAHRRFGRSVVVDCGSATTVNLVEQDGTFCGGAIAPGLAAFVAGLAAVTPALPSARLDTQAALPGRSSQGGVDAGVLFGYAGLVERLVADTLRACRGSARVVVTGGNAARLAAHSRMVAHYEPDLVHAGLCLLVGGVP